jgi:hypothetical protein
MPIWANRKSFLLASRDLARKIRRYIKAYSANAKPIPWKYSGSPALLTVYRSRAIVL